MAVFLIAACSTVGPTVYFSPNAGAADAVIRELDNAKKDIRLQAYGFTHSGIAAALAAAQKRGVDTEVILDKSNLHEHSSEAEFVAEAGVKTYIDSRHAIAHNKVIVIDGREVITGSFNFTKAAEEKNAENLLILKDTKLAGRYLQNWQAHLAHSDLYQPH